MAAVYTLMTPMPQPIYTGLRDKMHFLHLLISSPSLDLPPSLPPSFHLLFDPYTQPELSPPGGWERGGGGASGMPTYVG